MGYRILLAFLFAATAFANEPRVYIVAMVPKAVWEENKAAIDTEYKKDLKQKAAFSIPTPSEMVLTSDGTTEYVVFCFDMAAQMDKEISIARLLEIETKFKTKGFKIGKTIAPKSWLISQGLRAKTRTDQ